MPVYNYDFTLTAETPESTSRPAAGTDRFGLQVVPNPASTAVTVVLQGSISGSDWVDLAEATSRAPMVASGGGTKTPVVRYLRVVAKTLTGDGAAVAVHVVAK